MHELKLFVSNKMEISRLAFHFDLTRSVDADDFIRAFDGLFLAAWPYHPHDLITNFALKPVW